MEHDELLNGLAYCTGTTSYTRHGLLKTMLMTDGALLVADGGGAYWLMDVIASHLATNRKLLREHFQVWKFKRDGEGGVVTATTGEDDGVGLIRQEIPCSDFPLPEIMLFLVLAPEFDDKERGKHWVLMLPSEY